MSSTVAVPKWLVVSVGGPLIVVAIINGVATYYGQKALNNAVAELNETVGKLPTQPEVTAKYKFALYRIEKLEKQVEANAGRIAHNRDAINKLLPGDALWHPPLNWPKQNRRLVWQLDWDDLAGA